MNDAPAHAPESVRRRVGPVVVLFLLAFAARAGFGLAFVSEADLQFDDERWYWSIAQSYQGGDGMVGEFGHRAGRMPVYPWFLSLFTPWEHGQMLARTAQWVLGALAASLAYVLARSVCDWRAAFAAGGIVALDPSLVGCASLLLTETLFVTAAIGLWCVAWPLRRSGGGSQVHWVVTGLLAALCVYLRESSVLLVLALVVYLIVVRRNRGAVTGSVSVVLIVLALLAPWAYRNSRVIGQWVWLTTRGGISLYDGVREGATGASDLAAIKNAPETAGLNETQWDQHFRRAAHQTIAKDPARIAQLAIVKLGRTWSPVLHAAEYGSPLIRLVFACWYVPLYLLVAVGVYANRRKPDIVMGLLLPALVLSAIHSLYVGSVRYRVGAVPTLAILAVLGGTFIASRIRRRA